MRPRFEETNLGITVTLLRNYKWWHLAPGERISIGSTSMSCCKATYTSGSDAASGDSEGERFPIGVVPVIGISVASAAVHLSSQLKKGFQSGRNLHELLQSDIPT